MMACAKMVEEPVFFDITVGAETQAPGGELRTPEEQDPEPTHNQTAGGFIWWQAKGPPI